MRIRNFIKEIVVYGIIFFISALLLSTFIYAQGDSEDIMFYETDRLVAKLEYMKSNKNNIDTVFIGSSMTERGVIPEVFDEQTGLQSFNLGSAGVRSFRALQIVDELIAADSNTLKYVFLEIQPHVFASGVVNYNTNPTIFSTKWSHLPIYFEGLILKDGVARSTLFFNIIKDFAYKYTGFGIKKQIAIMANSENIHVSSDVYSRVVQDSGFMDMTYAGDKRREFLAKNSNIMKARADLYGVNVSDGIVTDLFTEEIISKVSLLQEMGVQVFILIPPRNNFLDYQLRQKHMYENNKITVIDLADYKEYPDFYFSDDFAYDPLHFNLAGAKKYTLELSKKFMTLANKTLVN